MSQEYLCFFIQSCKDNLFHSVTLSVGSMSISISFPVRVWNILTLSQQSFIYEMTVNKEDLQEKRPIHFNVSMLH